MKPKPQRQKKIAETYRGNLGYSRKYNYLRRRRFLLTVLVTILGVLAIWKFPKEKEPAFFNTGPLTLAHASLAKDCAACHIAADRTVGIDLAKVDIAQKVHEVKSAVQGTIEEIDMDLERLKQVARDAGGRVVGLQPAKPDFHKVSQWAELKTRGLLQMVSPEKINAQCASCHKNHDLHEPEEAVMRFKDFHHSIAVVEAGSCVECHKEHVGPGPMEMPTDATCVACHSDPKHMTEGFTRIEKPYEAVPLGGKVVKFKEGGFRLVPPRTSRTSMPLFDSFHGAHPPFKYEAKNLRDPNTIKYNHKRHEAADIPLLNGKKMDCATCHKTDASGSHFLPVKFEANCNACHSLHFDAKNPELVLPHGNPEGVRNYLRSLPFQYTKLAEKKGIREPAQVGAFVAQQLKGIQALQLGGVDIEHQVFFGGRVSFQACLLCHEVKPGAVAGSLPVVTKPTQVDRWLNGGKFDHVDHGHMSCADCHNASGSSETSDILMPDKASCTTCHRPSDPGAPASALAQINMGADRAQKQIEHGGIRSDCALCHQFHSPVDRNTLPVAGQKVGALSEIRDGLR